MLTKWLFQKQDTMKYEHLHQRDSIELSLESHKTDCNTEMGHNQFNPPRKSFASRIKILLLVSLATFGFVDLGFRTYTLIQSRRTVSCNCGDTIVEALSNNCKYDSIAAAWLPPACRNDDLIAKFEKSGPNPDGSWPYYADKNKTKTMTLHEVAMLPETGGHFFTTHHWHLVHCAYYWKKMFLAPEKGTTIEHRYNNLAHLDHCEMMFLKRDPLDKIVTEAGVALHSDRTVIAKAHGHDHHDHGTMMGKETY
ncbi:hypothetical protein DTO164E3_8996 [Paecilomyces variotii]|uniref:Uncharacterized protein n=1 Tax=Byssochlamys spectabilis TaxID=264951 RepID=A0A443I416_BYSSP|nr:hypothetical protein C8Q69DRAFT_448844 [Paecilomyces variotii]KAJ9191080.1 hypothetical protein DTO164E3_8996 [Paecilomyces variotii]KAJ9203056.1 hypothetical protein DTO032I3_3430 [Paecilomyces variotii]KAJ9225558.1 hypothetical protein DTO169C6_1994 [Paecilomyces variotii]KAJ9275705.1 hypothetical protein DTO021D3_7438 [Paecilomyces variotii]KAJ9343499.1 hypothetical protein DTO027B6_4076 [Paecilomyces variotii]